MLVAGCSTSTTPTSSRTRPAARLGDGTWAWPPSTSPGAFHREAMLAGHNRVGLSDAGHTLAGYRRLPHGWRTDARGDADRPVHVAAMARRSRGRASCPRRVPTVLHFPSHERREVSRGGSAARAGGAPRRCSPTPGARSDWLERLVADDFERACWLEAHWRRRRPGWQTGKRRCGWHVEKLGRGRGGARAVQGRAASATTGDRLTPAARPGPGAGRGLLDDLDEVRVRAPVAVRSRSAPVKREVDVHGIRRIRDHHPLGRHRRSEHLEGERLDAHGLGAMRNRGQDLREAWILAAPRRPTPARGGR